MGVLDGVSLRRVHDTQSAGEFMTWLSQRRALLGVDTETAGFNFIVDPVRLIQFGDLDTGWAMDWSRWSGVAIEALSKYEDPLVLHNAPFDSRMIMHNTLRSEIPRWPWERTHDTMTMAHLLDPLRPKGLKSLAALHIDPKAAQAQSMLDDAMTDHKWTWATVPTDFPYYWIYGAMDPVLTCRMAEKFTPAIRSSYLEPYLLELGTLRVVTNMMLKGAHVDLKYSGTKQKELMSWVRTARQWLAETYKISNPTSAPQVRAALEANGVGVPVKYTKGGGLSLDKSVLEGCDNGTGVLHPIAQYVLAIRRAEKTVAPYFANFLRLADDEDRVHPTIWALGTRTSRMSITEPGLQTLPRKDPTVRTAFIPTDEDHAILTCDFDQIEARLAAHFAQDDGMVAAFTGEDFFVGLAQQIFQDLTINKKDPRRQLTKNTVYGKLYGAGVAKMAITAGVPLDQMAPVVEAFDRTFPGVLSLQRAINRAGRDRQAAEGVAYVRTPTGRRIVADDDKEYTLTNYLIQAHAAEIFKRKLLELDAAGLGDYMILPVHDEVVMDVPMDLADELLLTVPKIMNDHTTYRVPITASADLMRDNWGSKYR